MICGNRRKTCFEMNTENFTIISNLKKSQSENQEDTEKEINSLWTYQEPHCYVHKFTVFTFFQGVSWKTFPNVCMKKDHNA